MTNEAAVPATSSGSAGATRPPGLLAAIRAHQGVQALKKAEPVSKSQKSKVQKSKSETLQDSLRGPLSKRREAIDGQDLGNLSKLIPEPEAESDPEDNSTGFEGKNKKIIFMYIYVHFHFSSEEDQLDKASGR